MKSNKTTVRQRVEEILSLRLLGAAFMDIRQHASVSGWNVGDRQLRRYIADGDDILAETLEPERENLLNLHIAQRQALYGRAVSVSDYSTALRILDSEAKLLGLFPPKQVELAGKDSGPIEINTTTDEQIVAELAAIFDAARAREAAGTPPPA